MFLAAVTLVGAGTAGASFKSLLPWRRGDAALLTEPPALPAKESVGLPPRPLMCQSAVSRMPQPVGGKAAVPPRRLGGLRPAEVPPASRGGSACFPRCRLSGPAVPASGTRARGGRVERNGERRRGAGRGERGAGPRRTPQHLSGRRRSCRQPRFATCASCR